MYTSFRLCYDTALGKTRVVPRFKIHYANPWGNVRVLKVYFLGTASADRDLSEVRGRGHERVEICLHFYFVPGEYLGPSVALRLYGRGNSWATGRSKFTPVRNRSSPVSTQLLKGDFVVVVRCRRPLQKIIYLNGKIVKITLDVGCSLDENRLQ